MLSEYPGYKMYVKLILIHLENIYNLYFWKYIKIL